MGNPVTEQQRATLVVHVQPGAGRNEVVAFTGGVLRVRVAAPPVKGKANRELGKLLSTVLGVSKSNVTIEKGVTARTKTIIVTGLTQEQVVRLLERL